MNLRQLRAFAAIADHGSIAAASRALFVTQPAVTRTIRELEEGLGIALVERNSSGVSLTSDGEKLLARARLIIREFEIAREEMARIRGASGGKVRIGLSPLAGMRVLPRALTIFRRIEPSVSLEFIEMDQQQIVTGLRSGVLDLAVANLPQWTGDSLIASVELLVVPCIFATRKGGRFSNATSLNDLRDADWLHQDASEGFPSFISGLFVRNGLAPPPQHKILRCTSSMLTSSFLMNNEVIAPMSRFILQVMPENILARVPIPFSPPEHRLLMLSREGGVLTQPAARFVDCIQEALALESPVASELFSRDLAVEHKASDATNNSIQPQISRRA